jgi:hypothetical protein
VLSHFDAVLYYTGDDLVPQDVTETSQRRAGTAEADGRFNLSGSLHLAQWGVRNSQQLRDYLNEGGKVVLSGRNVHVPFTSTGTGLQNYSGYGWWQDQAYGFNYPANQAGNDDRPHTAYFRELDVSNDFGQWFLGVASRQGGYGTTVLNGQAVGPTANSIFAGIGPIAIESGAGTDPNEDADGADSPRAKAPTRLRALSGVTTQRAFRQERVELDYANGADPRRRTRRAPGRRTTRTARAEPRSRRVTRSRSDSASSRSRPRPRASSSSPGRSGTCCPRRPTRRLPR